MDTTDPEKKKLVIEKGMENTVFAIEEIRKLSKSLVAPSLGDLGLLNALNDLAEDISDTGILTVTVESDIGSDTRFDKSLELMLYRVVQEQINNIRKYASAGKAVISLKQEGNSLVLTVRDDGAGFDPAKKAKGIGLRNIRSRVEYYSGEMKIISSPGKGCTLQVSIPLKDLA
jgi:two-component system sensor histidine kinase UhpB